MATDIFLKVEGVTGESTDSNHKEWTRVHSFSWGATQPGSMANGGGGGVGKVSINDLQVTALIDKATSALEKYCYTGQHVGKVELSLCKAAGEAGQIEYSKVTLEQVLITSVQMQADSSSESVYVQYSFQAGKVQHQYWVQTDKGGKGAESSVAYNVKENKLA